MKQFSFLRQIKEEEKHPEYVISCNLESAKGRIELSFRKHGAVSWKACSGASVCRAQLEFDESPESRSRIEFLDKLRKCLVNPAILQKARRPWNRIQHAIVPHLPPPPPLNNIEKLLENWCRECEECENGKLFSFRIRPCLRAFRTPFFIFIINNGQT